MIKFKDDVCDYLRLPDIPKKKWDGKTSFEHGVAVCDTMTGDECYTVVSFDKDVDEKPIVKKVFGYDIIKEVKSVFVVPSYMNDSDVEVMDLDEESKKRVKAVVKEAKEIENEGVANVELPKNEYFFDFIHDDEEARAFIEAYNKKNKIKGGIPKKHDTILMRLGVIWAEQNKQ